MLWGIWNGIFIIIERIINKNLNLNLQFNNVFITVLKKIYTLFVVNIGWVIFRAPYIGEAKAFISCMMGRPYEIALFSITLFQKLSRKLMHLKREQR